MTRARNTAGRVTAEPPLRRSVVPPLNRLIAPNQILRFPTEDEWTAFKTLHNVPDDAYERIEHTDPLGFDGGKGEVFKNGLYNRDKNYLRREQLPNMRINMSNVYQPYITGESVGEQDNYFFSPFLAQKNGKTLPEVLVNGSATQMIKAPGPLAGSLTPFVFTCKEAREMAEKIAPNEVYPLFFVKKIRQECGRTRQSIPAKQDGYVYMHTLINPNMVMPVRQDMDCSQPTLGCFWFNDGRSGQTQLPQDPECRVGVVIRFKKHVLL